ncbi:MAG: polyprenyl synthetase family protein [Elusimicrobia bacterium]|nr:polyprenyl synthetase family protein [Elusimicrobiota bacterium]
MRIEKFLENRAASVNAELKRRIEEIPACHPRLLKAMLYSIDAGGKRLRPALLTASYELFGGNYRRVLRAAAAVEMVHTYSLIHDDLPAMDDDDLRRGRPTSHKVFGEAPAILAGDALLTNAFSVLCGNAGVKGIKAENVLRAAAILARRAGAGGMVSGQAADLEAEGFLKRGAQERRRTGAQCSKAARLLAYIHLHKTSDLITASVEMGAALAGAAPGEFKALSGFARAVGLCFQITDDVLDVVGDKKKLGKSGSDAKNAKLTYASLYGVERSRAAAAGLLKLAHKRLKALPYPAAKMKALADIADFVCSREK